MKPVVSALIGAASVVVASATIFFSQSGAQRSHTAGIPGKEGTKLEYLEKARAKGHDLAMFAAGCFWGVEADFRQVPGVIATAVGFSGGKKENVSYKEVCNGDTGHAEVVLVEFDPKKVTYEYLVRVFYENHDPTTVNRQGPDFGEQYRSAIFTFDDPQMAAAKAVTADLTAKKKYRSPIVTQIAPAGAFWMAEEYHQQYYEKKGIFHNACRLPGGGGG